MEQTHADRCTFLMLMSCDNSPRTAGPKLGRPPQNRASLEAGNGETRAWISAFCERLSLQAWRRGVGSVRMRGLVPGSQSPLLMSCACEWVDGACVWVGRACVQPWGWGGSQLPTAPISPSQPAFHAAISWTAGVSGSGGRWALPVAPLG